MAEDRTYNIFFCGIGGQGVLTASEICGVAAMKEGFHVKKSEVHGMAQRGGSVESHLRFGKKVYSPLIPEGEADFLVSFYRDEHDRLQHFLKKDGVDLVSFLENAETTIKDTKFINTYLLGVLSRDLPVSEESWFYALETVLSRMIDENKDVFMQGRNES